MYKTLGLVAFLGSSTAALAGINGTPVPEPETLAMLAAGMGAIWLVRRFRRK